MKIKELPAHVKAAADGQDAGQFTAIVSVFGNVDSYGDVVLPGAFADTLAEWKASGNPIPVIWSHDWSDPFSHIGYVLDAEEVLAGDERLPESLKANGGLMVTGQLDMDNPKAVQVYRLMKGGRVSQFSFAYDEEEAAWIEDEDGLRHELRRLKVHEVGPCLVGANQETELLAVKAAAVAAGLKEGRILAATQVDKLKAAQAALAEIIAAADHDPETSPPDGGEKGADAAPKKDDSRPETSPAAAAEAAADGSKSGAAPGPDPARVRSHIDLEIELAEFDLASL